MQTSPNSNLLSIHDTHCLLACLPLLVIAVFFHHWRWWWQPETISHLDNVFCSVFCNTVALKNVQTFSDVLYFHQQGNLLTFFFPFRYFFCVFLVLFSFQREFLLHSEWKHVRYRSFSRRLSCSSWFKCLLKKTNVEMYRVKILSAFN